MTKTKPAKRRLAVKTSLKAGLTVKLKPEETIRRDGDGKDIQGA